METFEFLTRLGKRLRFSVPKRIAKSLRLKEGDYVKIRISFEKIEVGE